MKLIEAVNLVKSCVSDGDLVEVLSNICIDENRIIAYNGAQAMIVETDGVEGISCAVPGTKLIQLLNALPESTKLVQDGSVLKISCKKTKTYIDLVGKERERFIFANENINTRTTDYIVINDEFITGLGKCIDTVKDDASKIEQTGITVISSRDANMIQMYSTDSIQLSSYRVATKIKYHGTFMMPKSFCQTLLSLKNIFLNAKMFVDNDSIMIKAKEIVFFSHLMPDIVFMSFSKVIKENYNDNVAMFSVPVKLSDSLTRCMLINTSEEKRVTINTKEGSKVFDLVGTSQIGEIKERIVVKDGDFVDNTFIANGDFFKNMLSNVTEIGFNKKGKHATVIIGKKDDTFLRIQACFSSGPSNSEEE